MRRPRSRCAAFTLIELIIVVIVLGILLAVVLPNFFGATTSAKNDTAKQYLATSYKVARLVSTASGNPFDTDGTPNGAAALAAKIHASEPELQVTAGPDLRAVNGLPPSGS